MAHKDRCLSDIDLVLLEALEHAPSMPVFSTPDRELLAEDPAPVPPTASGWTLKKDLARARWFVVNYGSQPSGVHISGVAQAPALLTRLCSGPSPRTDERRY